LKRRVCSATHFCSMCRCQRCKDVFINFVDFRLKQFNKPFLLAILIGTGQVVLVAVIFVFLMTNCPTQQIVAPDAYQLMDMVYARSSSIHCLELANTRATDGDAAGTIRNCYLPDDEGVKWCTWVFKNANNAMMEMDHDYNPRCPFSFKAECQAMFPIPMEDVADPSKLNTWIKDMAEGCKLAEITKSADPQDIQFLSYRTCPDPMTVLGSALGYSGFIQFGLTVVIVSLLWMCGIVNTKDSAMMTWMKKYVQEFGKEPEKQQSGGTQIGKPNAWEEAKQPQTA